MSTTTTATGDPSASVLPPATVALGPEVAAVRVGEDADGGLARVLLRAGRLGWAVVGIAAGVAVLGLVVGRLSLVVVPVVLALFPATLLMPVVDRLRARRVPDALAAGIALLGGTAAVGVVIGLMVPIVAAGIPQLAETAANGIAEVERILSDGPFGLDLGGISGLMARARQQLGDLGALAGPVLDAATAAFELVAGSLLLVVVLFFFLKDGARIAGSLVAVAPSDVQPRLRGLGEQAWRTLGAFFRGQVLIAFVDALAIGVGLVLLRVPLALPLAVLVFFGGLFPIVGAVTTGILAVLVALAHGGLGLALAATVLVVGVQQLEGNILEPLIMGHIVRLHPLVVVLAVAAGAIGFGVLGAFLAVPIAAVTGRIIDDLRRPAAETRQTITAP